MAPAVYLDANVLIEAIEGPSSDIMRRIERLRTAGQRVLTSELTFAEVLMKPMQARMTEVVQLYEGVMAADGLVEAVPIGRDVLRKSAEVRAWLGGKLPDTIHVATAILAGCDVIVSSDKRLRMPHGLRRIAADAIGLLDDPS